MHRLCDGVGVGALRQSELRGSVDRESTPSLNRNRNRVRAVIGHGQHQLAALLLNPKVQRFRKAMISVATLLLKRMEPAENQ